MRCFFSKFIVFGKLARRSELGVFLLEVAMSGFVILIVEIHGLTDEKTDPNMEMRDHIYFSLSIFVTQLSMRTGSA